MISGGGRTQSWTSFNQLKTVTKGGSTSTFEFGAAHERVKQVSNTGTTIYVGGIFELTTGTGGAQEKNFIMTPTGRVAVATFGGSVAALGATNYFHSDGLGSITTVTDENGNVVKRFAFDAWGKRINPATGVMVTSATNGTFTRGYTDHEHLDDVGLIHMNGRVYDPILGRFLSADPNVDGVYDSQGYNRYSYVGNNPMNTTDPSGFFKLKEILPAIIAVVVTAVAIVAFGPSGIYAAKGFWAALGAGIGKSYAIGAAALGGFAGSFSGSLLNGGSIGDAFKAGIVGAAVGAATAWAAGQIGGFFNELGGGFGSWGGRTLAHGVVGGAASELQGGEFRHGFYASASSAGVMHSSVGRNLMNNAHIAVRTATAAIIGGTTSALGGGKFANGATTAAFQHLFNAEASRTAKGSHVHEEVISWYEEFSEDSFLEHRATLKVSYDVINVAGVPTVMIRDVTLGDNWMGTGFLETTKLGVKWTVGLEVGYIHEIRVMSIDTVYNESANANIGRAMFQVNKWFRANPHVGVSKLSYRADSKPFVRYAGRAADGVIEVAPPLSPVIHAPLK